MYSTGIIMYIGLHVQYRYYYVYRSACTVPVLLCISVCMYSTGIIVYIGLHVQYRYYCQILMNLFRDIFSKNTEV